MSSANRKEMVRKQGKLESKYTFGWTVDKDGKPLSPKRFELPEYVQDRVDWVISHIWNENALREPILTFWGAAQLLLDFEHEKELKEQYEKQFNDWKPFDDKYKAYFKDVWFGDYRQIRVLEAIIFVR